MAINKNKIHNPQLITDEIPNELSTSDLGRLWINKKQNTISIAVLNNETVQLNSLMHQDDMTKISNTFYSGVETIFGDIISQEENDPHFESGYDFFSDNIFKELSDDDTDFYYSYFYKEVSGTDDPLYIRSISTVDGVKHIRKVIGTDVVLYDEVEYNHIHYSKIILPYNVKEVVSIMLSNNDEIDTGYILNDEKTIIYLYLDPEGYFIGQRVKIKVLV